MAYKRKYTEAVREEARARSLAGESPSDIVAALGLPNKQALGGLLTGLTDRSHYGAHGKGWRDRAFRSYCLTYISAEDRQALRERMIATLTATQKAVYYRITGLEMA